jgi:hypothetical protein
MCSCQRTIAIYGSRHATCERRGGRCAGSPGISMCRSRRSASGRGRSVTPSRPTVRMTRFRFRKRFGGVLDVSRFCPSAPSIAFEMDTKRGVASAFGATTRRTEPTTVGETTRSRQGASPRRRLSSSTTCERALASTAARATRSCWSSTTLARSDRTYQRSCGAACASPSSRASSRFVRWSAPTAIVGGPRGARAGDA